MPNAIVILAEWPPGEGDELPRLIEIEDDQGRSLDIGEWRQRPDELWELRIPLHPDDQ